MRQISTKVTVPIIASGGMGKISDIHELTSQTEISAVAVANSLHYEKISIKEIKAEIASLGFKVRI
jgi:cyclase